VGSAVGLLNPEIAIANLDDISLQMVRILNETDSETLMDFMSSNYSRITGIPTPEGVIANGTNAVREFTNVWAKNSTDEIMNTMRGKVAGAIEKGLSEELGVNKITNNLREIFKGKNGDYSPARTIARTETKRASNAGKFEAYKQIPEVNKIWVAGGSGFGREDRTWHTNLNGKILKMNEQFEIIPDENAGNLGVEYCLYPHDTSLSAGNVVNCICDIQETFEEPN